MQHALAPELWEVLSKEALEKHLASHDKHWNTRHPTQAAIDSAATSHWLDDKCRGRDHRDVPEEDALIVECAS